LIGEKELEAAWLADRITAWLDQPEQLADMAARARELGRPDAARALADALESLARAPARLQREALA
jgi:UDP-N-acetylglucosamine--N-acetylmuramyl-(pentapeptide) pyrophosphoryl-undecaprenol N-acetylglucosamine transferase